MWFYISRKIDKYERRRVVKSGTATNDANADSSSSTEIDENKTITVNITISSDGNDTAEKVTVTHPNVTETDDMAAATTTIVATKWTEIQRKVSEFNENNYFQHFVTVIILVASVTLVTMASIDTIFN